jgi:cation transport regulator
MARIMLVLRSCRVRDQRSATGADPQHLPRHAQDIGREAFNSAYARAREVAHRIAWAAVKRRYVRRGWYWVGRASSERK